MLRGYQGEAGEMGSKRGEYDGVEGQASPSFAFIKANDREGLRPVVSTCHCCSALPAQFGTFALLIAGATS